MPLEVLQFVEKRGIPRLRKWVTESGLLLVESRCKLMRALAWFGRLKAPTVPQLTRGSTYHKPKRSIDIYQQEYRRWLGPPFGFAYHRSPYSYVVPVFSGIFPARAVRAGDAQCSCFNWRSRETIEWKRATRVREPRGYHALCRCNVPTMLASSQIHHHTS